jgi:hypothetical protein
MSYKLNTIPTRSVAGNSEISRCTSFTHRKKVYKYRKQFQTTDSISDSTKQAGHMETEQRLDEIVQDFRHPL